MKIKHILYINEIEFLKASSALPYLYPSFGEFSSLCQFFPRVDVGILSSFESFLEFVQLLRCESRSASPLLSFQWNARFRFAIRPFAVLT